MKIGTMTRVGFGVSAAAAVALTVMRARQVDAANEPTGNGFLAGFGAKLDLAVGEKIAPPALMPFVAGAAPIFLALALGSAS